MPTLAVDPLAVTDVFLVAANQSADGRHPFSKAYNRTASTTCGIDANSVQDNHWFSAAANIVRSLQFQILPAAQSNLMPMAKGLILDVAFGFRHG
jgi:dTDP-4-dehydrorhamnose 3,5-epimerase-like enzyme